MIVCHSRRFVFVHIHKTAGESITSALSPSLVDGDWEVRGKVQPTINGTVLRKHSTALEALHALGPELWEQYFTFGFVSHPIDRVLSLYRYIVHWADPPQPNLRQCLRPRAAPVWVDRSDWPEVRAYRATRSLSGFLRHPLLDNAQSMRPQVTSLCDADGRLVVDFVGRFEHLSEDFADVQRKLGLPPTSLRTTNVSSRTRDAGAQLTSDDRNYLATRFAVDFERFGYRP